MNLKKQLTPLKQFRFVVEAFARSSYSEAGGPDVLIEVLLRFGHFATSSVSVQQLLNFASDPNVTSECHELRMRFLVSFVRWASAYPYEAALGDLMAKSCAPEGGIGPVLPVEQARAMLAQMGRPWTIPYLAPRLFLAIEHAAALGFLRGGDSLSADYPVVLEQIGNGPEQRHDCSSAFRRWLEPYRQLRDDEPLILDPRIAEYVARQAEQIGLPWDEWLTTRTYAAYRLAVSEDPEEVARHTGFPSRFILEAFSGLVSRQDAMKYFELTPKACRRHNWNHEVAQCLEWYDGGYQFGISLRQPAST